MKALRILIFVLIMGIVSGIFLVGVNKITAQKILKNEELKLKSSVLDALEIPYENGNPITSFDNKVRIKKIDNSTFYIGPDNSVCFEFFGPGLWGPISGIISLEKDLKTIRKMKITHQEETPGLGGRIAEESYLRQFKNKEILPRLNFMPEGHARLKNEVDAITGATGSSRALERLINETLQSYIERLKRG